MKTQPEMESKIVEHYEKIQDFAQKEINRTFTVYKFLFWGLTTLFILGITIGTILIGKSLTDIESKYETKYQESLESVKQAIRKELENELTKTKNDINESIGQEFNKENINNLVEANAKRRIDLIADKLIEAQVEHKIIPLKQELEDIKTSTNNNIDKIIFDYYELGVYNDSKKAFIGLYEISENNLNIYQRKAQEIIKTKISDLEVFYKREYGNFGSVIDINLNDLDKLHNKYKTELSLDSRFYFVEDFWKNSTLDKKFKIDLIKRIYNDEIGLKTSYYITKILVKENNLSVKSYDFERIQNEIYKKH